MPKKKPLSIELRLEADIQELDKKKNRVASTNVEVTRAFTAPDLADHLYNDFQSSDEPEEFAKQFVGDLVDKYGSDAIEEVARDLAKKANLEIKEE